MNRKVLTFTERMKVASLLSELNTQKALDRKSEKQVADMLTKLAGFDFALTPSHIGKMKRDLNISWEAPKAFRSPEHMAAMRLAREAQVHDIELIARMAQDIAQTKNMVAALCINFGLKKE